MNEVLVCRCRMLLHLACRAGVLAATAARVHLCWAGSVVQAAAAASIHLCIHCWLAGAGVTALVLAATAAGCVHGSAGLGWNGLQAGRHMWSCGFCLWVLCGLPGWAVLLLQQPGIQRFVVSYCSFDSAYSLIWPAGPLAIPAFDNN